MFKESESGDISRSEANFYWICSLITSSSLLLIAANHSMMIHSTIDRYKKRCRELNWRHDTTRRWGEGASCVFVLKVNFSTTHTQTVQYVTTTTAGERWVEMSVTRRGSGRLSDSRCDCTATSINYVLSHMLYKYGVILLQNLSWVFSGNIRFLVLLIPKKRFFKKMCPHPPFQPPRLEQFKLLDQFRYKFSQNPYFEIK